VASRFQLKFQIFAELRTPSPDLRLHSPDDALVADGVLGPVFTVIVEIQQNGMLRSTAFAKRAS
jgi:hypothetical protein